MFVVIWIILSTFFQLSLHLKNTRVMSLWSIEIAGKSSLVANIHLNYIYVGLVTLDRNWDWPSFQIIPHQVIHTKKKKIHSKERPWNTISVMRSNEYKKNEMKTIEHQNRRNGESCSSLSPVSIFFNCTNQMLYIKD